MSSCRKNIITGLVVLSFIFGFYSCVRKMVDYSTYNGETYFCQEYGLYLKVACDRLGHYTYILGSSSNEYTDTVEIFDKEMLHPSIYIIDKQIFVSEKRFRSGDYQYVDSMIIRSHNYMINKLKDLPMNHAEAHSNDSVSKIEGIEIAFVSGYGSCSIKQYSFKEKISDL